uniref:Carboxylic ester hydrolase n=1 Tax=Acrobeloides nanus TaxID=290746 RepID=A0A914CFM5_9BILA
MFLKFPSNLFTLLLAILISRSDSEELDPVVETNYGKLQGFTIDLENNEKADIFLNIPFAKPPVGELRFEKPQPPEPWTAIREAKSYGPACVPHVWSKGAFGKTNDINEDCLTLNVYRPNKKSASKNGYPVLVWVHGGGFGVGSAVETGYINVTNNFIPQDIIVVAIQYRLGPLGWISTGDSTLPGNLGYWDMTASLKFIHENIKNFGGNPEKVTVWGESAGSAAVLGLTLSPYSRDYVSQSIEMSGSVLAAWGSNEAVVEVTKELSTALNCSKEDSTTVKTCWKTKSVDEILEAVLKISPNRKEINVLKFQPRVDGDFFPEDYIELIKKAPQKPAMIGFTDAESALFTLIMDKLMPDFYVHYSKFQEFGSLNLTQFIREIVAPESLFRDKAKEVQEKLIDFYETREKPQDADYKFYLDRYTQIFSDTGFVIPALLTAKEKMENKWPVYLYQNEHYNKNSLPENLPVKGSMHAMEYFYLHGLSFFNILFDEDDKKFQEVLIQTVANFVKTGNPSLSSLEWPKLTKEHPLRYLSYKAEPEVKEPLLKEKFDFWTGLSKNYSYDIIRGVFVGKEEKGKEEL